MNTLVILYNDSCAKSPLFSNLTSIIKTCPDGQVLKLWLRGMDLLRHLGSFALLTAILPSGSRLRLNHAFSVVQTHATGKNKNVPLRPHFYFNWLCSVCSSRTNIQELTDIGRKIESLM